MIYTRPGPDDPIHQGDIFRGVPRVDFSLSDLRVITQDNNVAIKSWAELLAEGAADGAAIVVSVRPVDAIVLTQDCDAVRSPDITLCEVRDFRQVERQAKDTTALKSWIRIITQQARINQKWFYLPPDPAIGINQRLGADFLTTIRIGRMDLEAMKADKRIAGLKQVALEHFRERVSEFFRRYPYNEWYPFSREEFEEYSKASPEPVDPYDWQKRSQA